MIRDLCYYGNPILRKKALPVKDFNEDLKKLVDDMIETMLISDGVGLAAPQIGESIQLAIVDPSPHLGGTTRMILVNPEITPVGNQSEVAQEGCLSVPGIYAKVKRPLTIEVKAQDIHGEPLVFEASGFTARIILHETDHLKGMMFVDKVIAKDKPMVEQALKELLKNHA